MISYEKQKIQLDGVPNARQLGGYIVSGGKRIKNNVILRTGALFAASVEVCTELSEKYRVSDIIDFRMEQEVSVMPDPDIMGAKYHHISVLNDIPMTKEDFEIYKELIKCGDMVIKYKKLYGTGIDISPDKVYRSLVFSDMGKEGYRRFFDILLKKSENSAILFHCTQGKDRTGMAAALLLAALGADRQTITEDYMMTNTACGSMLDKIKLEMQNENVDKAVLDFALFLESVDKSFIEAIFDIMDKEYGSVVGYLEKELGLTADAIEDLRKLYLEDNKE